MSVRQGQNQLQPISFNVSYTLREYLDFVRNHALIVMNQELALRGKGPLERLPLITLPFVLFPAAIGFFFKKREMPVCCFGIDEDGIVRTTNDGPYEMPWKDVVSIHRYPCGYLVTSTSGAFPLPNRCFDAAQACAFDELVETKLSELREAT